MTTRQHLFCHHLCHGRPARTSAIAAGYSITTINQNLHHLLRSPRVLAYLERHIAQSQKEWQALNKAFDHCSTIIDEPGLDSAKRLDAMRLLMRIISALRRAIGGVTPNVQPDAQLQVSAQIAIPETEPTLQQLKELDLAHTPIPPMHRLAPFTQQYANKPPIAHQQNTNENQSYLADIETDIEADTETHSPSAYTPQKPSFKEQMKQLQRQKQLERQTRRAAA